MFLQKSTQLQAYDELQAAGLVQVFEFTFELAWKTLKDYLEFLGIAARSPREAIKESFSAGLLQDGHLWINMLEKRDELTHTYNDAQSKKAIDVICHQYFPAIKQVFETLAAKR